VAQEPAGLVTAVTGEAVAEMRKASRALAPNAPVFVGERIVTGAQARASMKLGSATSLQLGENAKLKIDRFIMAAGGTITLGAGALLFNRPADAGDEPIRIRSPYGQIAVRGTQFFAGPSNNVFGVFVVRGSVAVSAAGKEVILAAGEGADIRRRGAPPTVPRRWGEERIRAALAQVN
jgi:ferric-dicitrate binding protein FerR (iron transport regulator)